MRVKLISEEAKCEIDCHGAELKSFEKNGREYMWCANPEFWGRTAPVLFPFVGQVAGGVFRYKGSEYPMGQHGFARDMDFELVSSGKTTAVFKLAFDEQTLKKYPMPFVLVISYALCGSKLNITWEITNPANENLYFSIGAHPAFNCTLCESELHLYKNGTPVTDFENHMFGPGLLTGQKQNIHVDGGVISMNEHTFDGDAFVIEDRQVDKVELWTKNGTKQVSVEFDMPLVGLWSPPKKNAPFVCIEPWYGRADRVGFAGDLSEREWGNTLAPGKKFGTQFTVEVF